MASVSLNKNNHSQNVNVITTKSSVLDRIGDVVKNCIASVKIIFSMAAARLVEIPFFNRLVANYAPILRSDPRISHSIDSQPSEVITRQTESKSISVFGQRINVSSLIWYLKRSPAYPWEKNYSIGPFKICSSSSHSVIR